MRWLTWRWTWWPTWRLEVEKVADMVAEENKMADVELDMMTEVSDMVANKKTTIGRHGVGHVQNQVYKA